MTKQTKAASRTKKRDERIRLKVSPKNQSQARYLELIATHEMTFGIGPAGTGKTYLAVVQAINFLDAKKVERIVVCRPIVEAGEKLGFLPGSFQDKVDPYMRPIYDALYEMVEHSKVASWFEEEKIETVPLAFMRGRTLKNSFVILDEAQNTTCEQMKMFLTRMGEGSKVVINGDPSQIDLGDVESGLDEAQDILEGRSESIGFQHFDETDVVRHPLVSEIVKLYQEYHV